MKVFMSDFSFMCCTMQYGDTIIEGKRGLSLVFQVVIARKQQSHLQCGYVGMCMAG